MVGYTVTMTLAFSKMHGLGNDFVVIDTRRQPVALTPDLIRRLADRHTGVGFDQLLLIDPPPRPDVDVGYRIFNADGGEVGQCGNGVRCIGCFLQRRSALPADAVLRVATRDGVMDLSFDADGEVTATMGLPTFDPPSVPFVAAAAAPHHPLQVDGQTLDIGVVALGNPHAVLWVDDVDLAPVATLGPAIQRHPRFPAGVNVGFAQRLDPHRLRLRVFERGVGETRACGSGACAAVAVGRHQGLLPPRVAVELPGGRLTIAWEDSSQPLTMTGPAVHVFDGTLELAGLEAFV